MKRHMSHPWVPLLAYMLLVLILYAFVRFLLGCASEEENGRLEVTGSACSVAIYASYRDAATESRLDTVLPWERSFDFPRDQFVYLAAVNTCGVGDMQASIWRNGSVIDLDSAVWPDDLAETRSDGQ